MWPQLVKLMTIFGTTFWFLCGVREIAFLAIKSDFFQLNNFNHFQSSYNSREQNPSFTIDHGEPLFNYSGSENPYREYDKINAGDEMAAVFGKFAQLISPSKAFNDISKIIFLLNSSIFH